jgi:hypothetical protein
VEVELLAVTRGDTGRLLPAMLERMKPEVREVRRLGVPVDAEDATLVPEVVVNERQLSLQRRRLSTFSIPTDATPTSTPRDTDET